jgi:hypothetical protein
MATLDLSGEVEAMRLESKTALRDMVEGASSGAVIDVEEVVRHIERSGTDPQDFQDLVEITGTLRELDDLASGADAIGKALHESRGKLRAHREKTSELLAERRRSESPLESEVIGYANQIDRAQRAKLEAQALRCQHRVALGLEIDLDRFSLHHNQTVINTSDPAAEVMEVDAATFRDESDRRRQILADFEARRQAEFARAFDSWAVGKSSAVGGRVIEPPNDPAPRKPDPATWRQCLEGRDLDQ